MINGRTVDLILTLLCHKHNALTSNGIHNINLPLNTARTQLTHYHVPLTQYLLTGNFTPEFNPKLTTFTEEKKTMGNGTRDVVNCMAKRICEAWNSGNMKAVGKIYAEDASLPFSHKGIIRGRENIIRHYQKFYQDKRKMGTLSLKVLEFQRFGVSNEVVSVFFQSVLTDDCSKQRSGLSVVVFVLGPDGQWLIAQDASL